MMKYKVAYKNPTSQYIPIEAEFDTLEEQTFELQFPAWRPGRYELGNFAKNIHGFAIVNEDGQKCDFKKTSKDAWLVDCSSAKSIKVSYKYYAAELNAGSSFMDDLQLYINPVNCFIYNNSRQEIPCIVELDIPENFSIACGAEVKKKSIKTASFHELVDSPFIASASMTHESFEAKGVKFHLWFQGEIKLNLKKVVEDFKKYTYAQIEKFEEFPVKEYHYLFQILAVKAYHGVEHQTSTVIALGPTYELSKSLYDELLGVSSHELYHTWNIKAIRPQEMYPYDYSKENYSNLGYVAEGVTTYLGDLFLCESGVKDFKWYKKEFEVLMQRHFDNFGRFNYSVAESSWDTWLDGYVAGSPNRKVSIYNEGALLSFISDIKIRHHSENNASIHSVMHKLYHEFAKEGKGYTEEDFKNIIEEFSTENQDEYFNNYYNGTHSFEPILVEALERVGLMIKMEKNPSHAQSVLGVKCLPSSGESKIHQIYPGSSAELGGLMKDDIIVSLNGKNISNNLDKWVEVYDGEQLYIEINRMGRILSLTCPNTNKSYFPIYKLDKVKVPSNLSRRIFRKWCGNKWDEVNI